MAATMMLCLFMGVLGTTWQAIVANAEREAAQAETRRAVRAERRAESNFKLAQNAADQMLIRLGEDRLKHVPHAEQIRRELLQDALELFNGLAHKESMLIFRELTRRFPENKTYQHELSISLKATGELRSSLDVLNKLIAMHPEDAELRETEMAVYAALASIHSSAGQREKAIEYSLIDLGTLPGESVSSASDVNESGWVVGGSWVLIPEDVDNDGDLDWYSNASGVGSTNDLMIELTTVPSSSSITALAINNSGQVAGMYWTLAADPADGFEEHAFLITPQDMDGDGGTIVNLGTIGEVSPNPPPFHYGEANGINESGEIVGHGVFQSEELGLYRRAFVISPEDADNDGELDWYADGDSDSKNDLMVELGTLDTDNPTSEAYAITDTRFIVGEGELSSEDRHGFIAVPTNSSSLATASAETTASAKTESGTYLGLSAMGDQAVTAQAASLWADAFGAEFMPNEVVVVADLPSGQLGNIDAVMDENELKHVMSHEDEELIDDAMVQLWAV